MNKAPKNSNENRGGRVIRPEMQNADVRKRVTHRGDIQPPRRSRVTSSSPHRLTVKRRRTLPENRPVFHGGKIDLEALSAKLKLWTVTKLTSFSIEKETLFRGAVCALLITVTALVQTTVFSTGIRPFGAVPDLMLALVIALGVSEGEKWGGVCGIASALVIDSLGTVGVSPLPPVYMLAGYVSGFLSRYYFRKNAVIRGMYQTVGGIIRGGVTLIMLGVYSPGYNFGEAMLGTVFPEFFATLILAPAVHAVAWVSLRYFHLTRTERTE